MSGKLKNKLKSKKGETITETLVSVLIAAAAMILFASMITSSQRILQKSESIMNAYYVGETNMEEAMATGGTTGLFPPIFVCLSHSRAVPHQYDLLNQSIR